MCYKPLEYPERFAFAIYSNAAESHVVIIHNLLLVPRCQCLLYIFTSLVSQCTVTANLSEDSIGFVRRARPGRRPAGRRSQISSVSYAGWLRSHRLSHKLNINNTMNNAIPSIITLTILGLACGSVAAADSASFPLRIQSAFYWKRQRPRNRSNPCCQDLRGCGYHPGNSLRTRTHAPGEMVWMRQGKSCHGTEHGGIHRRSNPCDGHCTLLYAIPRNRLRSRSRYYMYLLVALLPAILLE